MSRNPSQTRRTVSNSRDNINARDHHNITVDQDAEHQRAPGAVEPEPNANQEEVNNNLNPDQVDPENVEAAVAAGVVGGVIRAIEADLPLRDPADEARENNGRNDGDDNPDPPGPPAGTGDDDDDMGDDLKDTKTGALSVKTDPDSTSGCQNHV